MPWPFGSRSLQGFDLDVNPTTSNVYPGSSTLTIVNVKPYGPEQVLVKLTASASSNAKLPEGIKVTFNPRKGVVPFGSTMNIFTATALMPGKYSLLVVGMSRDMKQTANYTLNVQSQGPVEPKPA